MMIRLVSMSYIALVAGLVFGLYHVKLETQALQKQKAELVKNIAHADSDIDMLPDAGGSKVSGSPGQAG